MDTAKKEYPEKDQEEKLDDGDTIDSAFLQMEMLYRSRCVQPPLGSNVTIKEIKKDE
jgi:hypothetical protein